MHAFRTGRRVTALAAATVFLAVPAAWATTATVSPLEQTSGASPFAACTADNVAAQPGTVFPNSEVEPFIAVSQVDRSGDGAPDIIGVYQQDRWNNGGSRGVAASIRQNGVWQQVALPSTSACTGGSHLRATDPWVTFSPNGVAYAMSLATSAGNDSAMLVNKSSDGGLTWSAPTVLIEEDNPFNFNDKNSITADPFDSNFVYAIWDRSRFPSDKRSSFSGRPHSLRSDAILSRTTNGGQSWTTHAILVPQANQFSIGHQIVVLSDGTLVDGFMLFHGSGSNKTGQEVAVMRSTDRGATWSEPIRVAKALPGFIFDPQDGTPVRTEDIIPEIAAGPNGSVYMVWQEGSLSPAGSAIALSKSLDGGLTWSTPVRINTVPTTQAFTPSIEVSANGTIGVTHYDFRNDTSDPATLLTDYWFLHSPDGGATWSEARVTPSPFDMKKAPFARGLFVGDYEGLTTQGNDFLAYFSETHGTDPGSVFFSRITP